MAESFGKTRAAGGRADGAVETGCAQPVEEAPIHAGAIQQTHCARVAVRQDGFGAILGRDSAQTAGDGVESFVPGNALKFSFAFSTNSFLRIEQTVRGVLALQVAGDLAAEKSLGDRMIWVSTQPGAFSVIYIDEERAAVGAIEGTDGGSHFRHTSDYSFPGLAET